MKNDKKLINLLKLMQITRTQPQYGYALNGLKKHELSNLAEHHYLVTFIALQLTRYVNSLGARLNVERVIDICMVHDLGELFGGDISRPYALANPAAKKLAKAFESENQKFLQKYLTSTDRQIWKDVMEPTTDEGKISKLADVMECAHYLAYLGQLKSFDIRILKIKLPESIKTIKDKIAKKELTSFVKIWISEIQKKSATEILFD